MAWNTPTTVSTGDVLTATRYNADVQANLTEFASLFSAWTSWTPQIDQGVTTNIAKTVVTAKYVKVGRLVIANAVLTVSGTGTAGSSVIIKSASFPAAVSSQVFGSGSIYDSSVTTTYNASAQMNGSDFQFVPDVTTNQAWGANPNVAIASGDVIRFLIIYEATA